MADGALMRFTSPVLGRRRRSGLKHWYYLIAGIILHVLVGQELRGLRLRYGGTTNAHFAAQDFSFLLRAVPFVMQAWS